MHSIHLATCSALSEEWLRKCTYRLCKESYLLAAHFRQVNEASDDCSSINFGKKIDDPEVQKVRQSVSSVQGPAKQRLGNPPAVDGREPNAVLQRFPKFFGFLAPFHSRGRSSQAVVVARCVFEVVKEGATRVLSLAQPNALLLCARHCPSFP